MSMSPFCCGSVWFCFRLSSTGSVSPAISKGRKTNGKSSVERERAQDFVDVKMPTNMRAKSEIYIVGTSDHLESCQYILLDDNILNMLATKAHERPTIKRPQRACEDDLFCSMMVSFCSSRLLAHTTLHSCIIFHNRKSRAVVGT